MNNKKLILTMTALAAYGVMAQGALMAQSDATQTPAPVDAPTASSNLVTSSSTSAAVVSTQAAPTSGAIQPISSDYYAPSATAQGGGFTKIPLRLGVTLALVGDDNINISRTNKQSDFLQIITPTLTLETSRPDENLPFYAGLTFDPTIAFYDDHSQNNYTDYHVNGDIHYKWSQLLVGLTQSYDSYNGANVQFGGRLYNEVYRTRVYAAMPVTDKINWDIEGIQTFNRYDQGYNNNEWLADTYFDYAILPKVRLGVGGEFGFLNFVDGYQTNGGTVPTQANNTNQTFQQANLRLIYNYSDKLSFTGKLGAETRQYDSGSDTATPVADIGLVWRPFVHTTVQADVYRRTVAAIAQNNTNYDITGVDFTVQQGFLRHFAANLALGYNNSNYNNIVPTQTYSGLTYNYYMIKPSVDYHANKYFTASVYYEYQKNASTLSNSGFEDNQVGLSGSVAY